MGLIYQKKWSEAIVALKNCVARDPENSEAWFALGYAYSGQNGGKSCEASYEPYTRCIALDPKYALAHNNLGVLLQYVRSNYDDAERHYWKAIELDPKHVNAHNNLGTLLKNVRKDYVEAEEMYQKAIELDPEYAMAHCNLGTLLKDVRNNYDDAERHYWKAIELDPKHTSARWNLSIILEYQKNNIPGAIKLVEEYKNLGGDATKATKRLAALRGNSKTTQ